MLPEQVLFYEVLTYAQSLITKFIHILIGTSKRAENRFTHTQNKYKDSSE